jgi:predicted GNAT family acetyltransferase
MKLAAVFFSDAEAYYSDIERFLTADEVTNSLVLGVARNLTRHLIPRRRHPPLMMSVKKDSETVLVAMMPANHKMLLAGNDDGEAVNTLVRELIDRRTSIPSILGPADLVARFSRLWAEVTMDDLIPGMQQRLYKASSVTHAAHWPDGRLIVAPLKDRELFSQWVLDFQTEALPGEAGDLETARIIVDRLIGNNDLYAWQMKLNGEEHSVSMAAKARPTTRGIAINLVYTPPVYRRQGYASACVAHLTELLLASGWEFCTLFTDRTNETSNHIYQTIGYEPITDFDEFRFRSRRKT